MTCFTSATTSYGLRTALISSLLIAAACSACDGERECIEHQRTIERGVYGEAVYITPEGEYEPLYNVLLKVNEFGSLLEFEVRTNENGFYEVELPVGQTSTSHAICTEFAAAPCHSFASTGLVRLDLVIFEGLVFWDDTRLGECP